MIINRAKVWETIKNSGKTEEEICFYANVSKSSMQRLRHLEKVDIETIEKLYNYFPKEQTREWFNLNDQIPNNRGK